MTSVYVGFVIGIASSIIGTYVVRFIDSKVNKYKNNRHQNG